MSTPAKRIAFHTMGCKLNFSETATIARDFIRSGFSKVDFRDEADIYVLNTCSVTENADREARKFIRQSKRRNPGAAVAVIGCYAQLKPYELAKMEGVDLVVGATEKFNLLQHLDQIDFNGGSTVFHSEIDHDHHFVPSFANGDRTRAFLKVQDGCDYNCSFCTIPLARGHSRNDSIENTLKTARKIASTQACEIVLTGVNIGDFGQNSGESFLDLIRQLDTLEGIDRIRISSIEPNLLTDEIIRFCNDSEKFMPHFHIPLQSGSDRVLKKMHRRYKRKLFKERVETIKNANPDACIGADVIVGFPGESDDDFLATYHFINELPISYLHVFTYSERPNTPAVNLRGKVNKEIKAERSKMLHMLSDKKRRFFHDQFLGLTRPVLFESVKNNRVIGHTDNYITVEVDGQTNLINTIHPVKIIKNNGLTVKGILE